MLKTLFFVVIPIVVEVQTAPPCDLSSIFQTPERRKYDQLEILERSNFANNHPATDLTPKAFANAQILLRFGGDNRILVRPNGVIHNHHYSNPTLGCGCGPNCPCRNPQYSPYFLPQPLPFYPNCFYYPLHCCQLEPKLRLESDKQPLKIAILPQNDQQIGDCQIVNNHPEIMQPIKLDDIEATPRQVTDEQIKDGGQQTTVKPEIDNVTEEGNCAETTTPKIDETTLQVTTMSNREETTAKCDDTTTTMPIANISTLVENALVPILCFKDDQIKEKLLVAYPVAQSVETTPKCEQTTEQRPSLFELLIPKIIDELIARQLVVQPQTTTETPIPARVKYQVNSYKMASGSHYYSDPVKTVVYKQPTLLSVLGSKIYLPPCGGEEGCKCPSCTKYEKELNE